MSLAPRQGTDEWVEWRRGGLGASELAALIGEDPYRGARELALLKKGLIEPQAQTTATAWGHRVQELGIAVYAEHAGKRVRNVATTTQNPTWPHLYASLDGRVVGERTGVEVKWTARWEEPPRHVVIQCLGQMGIAKLDRVDVVRLGRYGEPAIYPIERDDLAIRDLLDLGEAWYLRYVLGDELPPIDGSPGVSRHLDRLPGGPEMVASAEQALLIAQLRRVRAELEETQAAEARLRNLIKDSMVGSYALVGDGFHVSWKPTKAVTRTDWRLVAANFRQKLEQIEGVSASELDVIESLHSVTSDGTRPFRVHFDDENEG